MAAKKKKASPWKNGVRKLGPGKYEVRLTWTGRDGKRHDTERTVSADSSSEAGSKREKLLKEHKEPDEMGRPVRQTADAYLLTPMPLSSKLSRVSRCKHIVAAFGDRKLGTIKPVEIQRFIHELPIADGSANAVRTTFAALYKFATERGDYGGDNPVRKTAARATAKSSEQLLEEQENPAQRAYLGDEAQRVLAHLDEDIRPLQALQLFLGCRFAEVSALRWSDVDLDAGTVQIRRGQYLGTVGLTKGKKPRPQVIGPHTIGILQAHRERMAELQWPGWDTIVFPRPPTPGVHRHHDMWIYQTVLKKVRKAQAAAGTTVVSRTHAMRHTHITAAEARRQMELDAAMGAAELKRQMLAQGHASEAQRAQYVDVRALPPSRSAANIEAAIIGDGPTEK